MQDKQTRNRSPEAKEKQLEIIVDSAIELFESKNLNFSMNELAKNSGLSSASSLYRYFNGKKELWDLICARDFGEFRQGLANVVKENSNPADAIYEMGRFFIDFSIED